MKTPHRKLFKLSDGTQLKSNHEYGKYKIIHMEMRFDDFDDYGVRPLPMARAIPMLWVIEQNAKGGFDEVSWVNDLEQVTQEPGVDKAGNKVMYATPYKGCKQMTLAEFEDIIKPKVGRPPKVDK